MVCRCIRRTLFVLLLLTPALRGTAQDGDAAAQGGTMSVRSGPPQKAVLDAEHRPITAGGFVASGPVPFDDISAKAGLTAWRHTMGTPQKNYILETVGSGVALLDYDNDGWLDIYLVNGSTSEALTGKAPAPQAALFHNNHDGTFTNVAAKAHVTNERWGFGAVAADFDNDGWVDLYVCNYGENRLYHNNHDGTFTDVAAKAGVTLGNWSSSATWGDYDGDGWLDLFVAGYVHFDTAAMLSGKPAAKCTFRSTQVMCGPRGLVGEPDHLFHNNHDGTFTDVSAKAGVADKSAYYGLAALFIDVNNDGKPDLLVADDSTPNYLYLNRGDGTFEDASLVSGYALNEGGRETASMGIATGDMDHKGNVDVYHTTFSDDYNPLYRNDGTANFTDVSFQEGIAEPTIPFLGWGTQFLDYDNDGWLDLFVANGHVYPEVDKQGWGTTWAQRPLLFHNVSGKLKLVPPVQNTALAELMTGRGLAMGDFFHDGRLSLVVNNIDGTPSLLQARAVPNQHWIAFDLLTKPAAGGSPRAAIGATLLLTANGVQQRGDVIAGGSFGSNSDQSLHFGLAAATAVQKVLVRWPSGLKEQFETPFQANQKYTLREGTGARR